MSQAPAIRILVDRNEGRSGIPDALLEYDDVEVAIATLPRGDYWIGGNLAVERKTVSDLISSIVEDKKRLFNQVRGIKDLGMRPIFIIEGGSLYDVFSEISEEAIVGALSYLVVIENATVLRSEGVLDTARLLAAMAEHAQHGLGYEVPLRAKARAGDLATTQQYLVEGLPGIGPKLARGLLSHFGSIQALLEADEAALCRVPGISKTRARAIRRVIDAPFEPAAASDPWAEP